MEEVAMKLFFVDEKKCKRDGICIAECPLKIIEMPDTSPVPVPAADAAKRCIRCGHCVAVCPHGAFTHNSMATEDFPLLRKDYSFTPKQAEHFLRSRRSIRTYRADPVDAELLTRLLEIARYAPTGSNSQLVGWMVVNGRPAVARLTGMVIDLIREMVTAKHPLALAYRLDKAVKSWERGKDTISRGAPALVLTHTPQDYGLGNIDCASALAYFDLAAPTLGLGACWAGFFMLAIPQWQPLREALAIPEGHTVHGVMMTGHPKYKYHRLVPRKAPKIRWADDL